jgi:hypothetical protein
MRPTAAAFVLMLAVTCTASAQTAPPSPNQTVTVRGCVAPAQRDGSQEARSAGNTPVTPQAAPDEANSGEFVNAYLLNDATLVTGGRPDAAASTGTYVSKPTSYTLQGLESEMAKHKGHRVEIVGTVQQPTKSGRGPGNKATAEGIQRVKVSSVKMIGNSCAAQGADAQH